MVTLTTCAPECIVILAWETHWIKESRNDFLFLRGCDWCVVTLPRQRKHIRRPCLFFLLHNLGILEFLKSNKQFSILSWEKKLKCSVPFNGGFTQFPGHHTHDKRTKSYTRPTDWGSYHSCSTVCAALPESFSSSKPQLCLYKIETRKSAKLSYLILWNVSYFYGTLFSELNQRMRSKILISLGW